MNSLKFRWDEIVGIPNVDEYPLFNPIIIIIIIIITSLG